MLAKINKLINNNNKSLKCLNSRYLSLNQISSDIYKGRVDLQNPDAAVVRYRI